MMARSKEEKNDENVYTTIRVKTSVRDQLNKRGTKNESLATIVERLLQESK